MANREIPAATLEQIVGRLRNGESALIAESKNLGFTHNGPLRAALRTLLGAEGYDDLMGGRRPIPTTGNGGGTHPADDGLPMIDSTSKKDGWSWRLVGEYPARPIKVKLPEGDATVLDSGKRRVVLKSPEGIEYVEADALEKAVLLRRNSLNPNGPPTRLALWEESALRRRLAREEKELKEQQARGEAGLQRKKNKGTPTTLEQYAGEVKEKVDARNAKTPQRVKEKLATAAGATVGRNKKVDAAILAGLQAPKKTPAKKPAAKPSPAAKARKK